MSQGEMCHFSVYFKGQVRYFTIKALFKIVSDEIDIIVEGEGGTAPCVQISILTILFQLS